MENEAISNPSSPVDSPLTNTTQARAQNGVENDDNNNFNNMSITGDNSGPVVSFADSADTIEHPEVQIHVAEDDNNPENKQVLMAEVGVIKDQIGVLLSRLSHLTSVIDGNEDYDQNPLALSSPIVHKESPSLNIQEESYGHKSPYLNVSGGIPHSRSMEGIAGAATFGIPHSRSMEGIAAHSPLMHSRSNRSINDHRQSMSHMRGVRASTSFSSGLDGMMMGSPMLGGGSPYMGGGVRASTSFSSGLDSMMMGSPGTLRNNRVSMGMAPLDQMLSPNALRSHRASIRLSSMKDLNRKSITPGTFIIPGDNTSSGGMSTSTSMQDIAAYDSLMSSSGIALTHSMSMQSIRDDYNMAEFSANPLYPDYTPESFAISQKLAMKEIEDEEKKQNYQMMIGHEALTHDQRKTAQDLDPRGEPKVGQTLAILITLGVVALFALTVWQTADLYVKSQSLVGLIRLIVFPIVILFVLFPIQILFTNFFVIFGPISWLDKNSKTYSGVAPCEELIARTKKNLPRVTIQLPVYKESLELTIKPTIISCLEAIAAYRAEGGEANMFVNDDGLVLLSAEERACRLRFYADFDVGFVARPKDGRRGRFKKASNLNYGLSKSIAVEKYMADHPTLDYATALTQFIDTIDPNREFGQVYIGGDIRVGDFILLLDSDSRVPEASILPVVTEFVTEPKLGFTQHFTTPMQIQNDYFEDAIATFTRFIYDQGISIPCCWSNSPPLMGHNAFLRYDAMRSIGEVDGKYWRPARGGAYVPPAPAAAPAPKAAKPKQEKEKKETKADKRRRERSATLEFTSISIEIDKVKAEEERAAEKAEEDAKKAAEKAAKQAAQEALVARAEEMAKRPTADFYHDYHTFWSEEHVSEDMVMSLKLFEAGYIGRYIRYTGADFKEGVSLTIHEEVRKMQKFAYGMAEMMFNPLSKWLTGSPISPLFRRYMSSKSISYRDKLFTLAYSGTYAAISFAFLGTVINYFVQAFYKDGWYVITPDSIDVIISCMLLFGAFCYVTGAVLSYRRSECSIWRALYRDITYPFILSIYFMGLGYHINIAFLKYLFGAPMEWGSTVKEVENTNFFKEVKRTISGYKWMYFFCFLVAAAIIVLNYLPVAGGAYKIDDYRVILPVALNICVTAAMPVLLNPVLMRVKF